MPLFTRRLHAGLSYAEDPGMNQSFGMSRSQMIAEGIVNAYQLRRNNQSAQFSEILKLFKENGFRHPASLPETQFLIGNMILTF